MQENRSVYCCRKIFAAETTKNIVLQKGGGRLTALHDENSSGADGSGWGIALVIIAVIILTMIGAANADKDPGYATKVHTWGERTSEVTTQEKVRSTTEYITTERRETTTRSTSQPTEKNTTTTGHKYNTSSDLYDDGYDDGYDDIYMDGDYDYDRYDHDSDYADGVDDALDEFGDDYDD